MRINRIASAVAMLGLALSSCAPLRVVSNTEKNGVHEICTSDLHLFDQFEMAMGMRIEKRDTILALLITCDKDSDHGVFDKDDRLLVRFTDGEEMSLKNIYNKEYHKETRTNYTEDTYLEDRWVYSYSPYTDSIYLTPVTFRTFVPRTYTTTLSHSYALYPITREQYRKLSGKGIAKLRIEIDSADCDMSAPENFSAVIKELHDFIVNVSPIERKKF